MLFIFEVLRSWNFVALSIRASIPIVNRIILHFSTPGKFSLKSTPFLQRHSGGIQQFTPSPASLFLSSAAVKTRLTRRVKAKLHTFSSLFLPRCFFGILALDIRQIIPYNAPKTTQGGNENALSSEECTVFFAGRVSFSGQ